MRILEFTDRGDVSTKVVALAEFLLGRATDKNAKKQISVEAFLELANQRGANLTRQSLIDLSQNELSEMFDIQGDKVVFKSDDGAQPNEMPVDKAQNIVKQAAKRAMKAHG